MALFEQTIPAAAKPVASMPLFSRPAVAQPQPVAASVATPKLGQAGYIDPNAPRYDINAANAIKAQQRALKGTAAWVPDPKTGVLPDGSYPAGQEWRAAAGGASTAQGSTATTAQTTPTQGRGVTPMTAEPLHEWEKAALTRASNPGLLGGGGMQGGLAALQEMMANPQAYAAKFESPYLKEYLGKADAAATAGMKSVGMDEIMGVQNPFAASQKEKLTRSGEALRAAITAGQGMRGGRSFGDTSTDVRNAELDTQLLQGMGDIDYKTFQDALGQINTERGRSLQGGGLYGNLAQIGQGASTDALRLGMAGAGQMADTGQAMTSTAWDAIDRQLNAGKYVRDYQQGVTNQTAQDILAAQGYEGTQIQNLMNLLKAYGGNSEVNMVQGGANTLQKIGGGADILGSLLSLLKEDEKK